MIRKTFCEGFAAGLLGLGAISLSGAAELRGIHLSTSADSAQVTLDLTEGGDAQAVHPRAPRSGGH